jgi:hypothetical protein
MSENGGRTLAQIEEDLYGPAEERRRPGRDGLMARVSRLEGKMEEREAHEQQLEAVAKMKRWMIPLGVSMFTAMLTLVGMMVMIMRALS